MAIFDNAMFDPQTYAGGMSGWLQQALQSGLLGKAIQQQQDQPTSIGNYGGVQYPIFGQAPPPAPTMEMSAQAVQQPQQQSAPSSPTFGQTIGNLATRLQSGMSPAWAQINQSQQAAPATYQALRQSGVPDGVARAAALNPEILKTIAPVYFDTSPKFQKVGPEEKLLQVNPKGGVTEVASGGPQKAPPGYVWADPSNPGKGLKPIPGGPESKLPANEAGYLAMMEQARPGVEDAKKYFLSPKFTPGLMGAVGQATNSFEIGRQQRAVQYAIEAALRVATGAAAPQTEVDRYARLFMPSVYDTIETRRQKLNSLGDFMDHAKTLMLNGRAPPQSSAGWVNVGNGVRIREKQ